MSTLWAIAPREVAGVIEQAHADAVADVLRWLEDNAAYTRTGAQGVAQVDVTGLLGAAFMHWDSRAGDPDLHTHVAVSNKVRTLDGRWLAVDGRAIYKNVVAASERYDTRIEALLVDRLGVRFADRPDTAAGRRPVREIVGVDGPLPRRWSSRRAAIDTRRAVLAAAFQVDHGRPPTAKEAIALAQQANLETREAKHQPRSHADQRTTWRTEALEVLGGEERLQHYLHDVLAAPEQAPALDVTPAWLTDIAHTVVTRVAAGRATWQEPHVRAEAERHARAAGIGLAQLDHVVDELVGTALSPPFSLRLGCSDTSGGEPEPLRRIDGSSVFDVAGSALYTSSDVLAAEEAVLAAAGHRDGRVTPPAVVEQAMRGTTADGAELNPGQAQLVRDLATSGARVQLALAPAGTGKTTALRALTKAWCAGGGTVVGLAPSAAASAVLREQIDAPTDTLAKLLHAAATGIDVPGWVTAIGPRSLVLVDEAGTAGTRELASTVEFVTSAGGSVRLIGDDQQLGAIGAGGLLRDLAATHGAARLTQVVRFTHPNTGAPNRAEGAASLALRDGDPAALAYYADHDRLHVGDLSTCTEKAYTAWAHDRAAGRDPLMLAPTRDLVFQLNQRARTDRLASNGPTGPEVSLSDGSHASAGDLVITRRNDRRLAIGPTNWVKNGDRWTIDTAHGTGALDLVHLRTGRHVTLPPDYVHAHVTLGYASTVHGAQGVTADSSYTIVTGTESRQLLYVAMTRGRHANHAYLTVVGDGDAHTAVTRDAVLPPTAIDVLTRVLARDDVPTSATSARADLDAPAPQLNASVDRYLHAVVTAAQHRIGIAGLAEIDALAETALPGLTNQDAYPALRARLAMLSIAGSQPAELLQQAPDHPRGLHDAHDTAAVLDWRIDPRGTHIGTGPLRWLPPVPEPLTNDPEWGTYLADRAAQITTLATAVAAAATAWTPATAPPWARRLLADPELVGDLSVWRAALGIEDITRPSGHARPAAAEARVQRDLDARATRLLGHPGSDTAHWTRLAEAVDPAITCDPFWPVLAERLSVADRAGIDVPALTGAVACRPLPDEQPAAALWWRLVEHLSPAVATTAHEAPHPLVPEWAVALDEMLGRSADGVVRHDPSWPALVVAVDEGRRSGWEPAQLLGAALDLLSAGQDHDDLVAGPEMATGLLWRVGLLIRPSAPVVGSDSDWLVGLGEPDDAEHPPEPTNEVPPVVAESVRRTRLLELNRHAADYFADAYPHSWAQAYLTDRIGTDLLDLPQFVVGHAPPGWTGLTDHLRALGATDEDIVAAGLGAYASTGRVIDRFRDRVVFAIQGQDGVLGWIGRRNPTLDDDPPAAVPKYLNTPDTELFTKGHELFGLTDAWSTLVDGATPVLVEGPLDALAISVAGEGDYVGVAPLGTAFTDAQADRLRPLIDPSRPSLIVATDSDRAGRAAAHVMFWRLSARGEEPRSLALPEGDDPAALLRSAGPDTLRAALHAAPSLAGVIIGALIDTYADRLDTVEGQVHATRRAAEVIAALPSSSWPQHLTHLVARTGIAADIALSETLTAADRLRDHQPRPSRKDVEELVLRPRSQRDSGHGRLTSTRRQVGTSVSPSDRCRQEHRRERPVALDGDGSSHDFYGSGARSDRHQRQDRTGVADVRSELRGQSLPEPDEFSQPARDIDIKNGLVVGHAIAPSMQPSDRSIDVCGAIRPGRCTGAKTESGTDVQCGGPGHRSASTRS